MREARSRHAWTGDEYRQHLGMQLPPAWRWQRVFERAADELVPIAERAIGGQNHAEAQAARNAAGIRTPGLFEQPRLGASGDDAGQLGDLARSRCQTRGAGENRIADSSRDPIAAGCEHLCEEERVASREAVETLGRLVGVARKLRDRGLSQRREQYASHVRPGQVADDDP